MYDDEEEEQIQKIEIPKYKILFTDLEMYKKEKESEVLNTNEALHTNPNNVSGDKKDQMTKTNYIEKILECNKKNFDFLFYYCILTIKMNYLILSYFRRHK
jgi:hypothetical protein